MKKIECEGVGDNDGFFEFDLPMTKDGALKAMREGHKVTHRHFSTEEWMKLSGGLYEFEDGCLCEFDEFWQWRDDVSWHEGWKIYKYGEYVPMITQKERDKRFKERKEAQHLKEMRGVYVPIKHEKALKAELRAKVKELMGEEK